MLYFEISKHGAFVELDELDELVLVVVFQRSRGTTIALALVYEKTGSWILVLCDIKSFFITIVRQSLYNIDNNININGKV
jgi:hypothetical protein